MKKILVIDDLPENVFTLQDRLESEGYEVITAYDGKTGIDKAVNEKPDLILLDIVMPDITGIEVCKTLISNENVSHIPIILVTAKSDAEDTKEGLEAGAFDYVKKPYNKIELLARVNSALKLSEAQKKVIEAEQKNTVSAMVVTTNHKIKQPLTLITLTSAAIKREVNKEQINKEEILKKLQYIETAVNTISNVLNELHKIKKPEFSSYVGNIKMVDVDKSEKNEE